MWVEGEWFDDSNWLTALKLVPPFFRKEFLLSMSFNSQSVFVLIMGRRIIQNRLPETAY